MEPLVLLFAYRDKHVAKLDAKRDAGMHLPHVLHVQREAPGGPLPRPLVHFEPKPWTDPFTLATERRQWAHWHGTEREVLVAKYFEVAR